MNQSFIPAGMDTPGEDLHALTQLVGEARMPESDKTFVVEVGSWAGRTAIAMADAGSLVWCVDTWRGSVGDPGDDTERLVKSHPPDGVFRIFCHNAGQRLFRTMFPCRGESTLWASVFPWQADMIFIDGDHRYEAVKADIAAWLPKVRPGGIICGHDYGVFEGVTRAVGELATTLQTNGHVIGRCVWWFRVPEL